MANCISLIGDGPTVDQMSQWSLVNQLTTVIHTQTLENVCLIDGHLTADMFCVPGVKCRDVCAIVLHECDGAEDKVIRIQTPPEGAYDSDEGYCLCIEGFCLTEQQDRCDEADLLDICQMMDDPCDRKKWLQQLWYQRMSGKTVLSASTPSGRSVTFVQVPTQCIKDELRTATIMCDACDPCKHNGRTFNVRNC